MRRFDPGPRLQFLRNPSRTRLYLCQLDVLGGTVTRLLISLNELFRLSQQLTGLELGTRGPRRFLVAYDLNETRGKSISLRILAS